MSHSSFVSPNTGRPVRAVLFDTFGTVVDWRSGIAQQVDAFAAERNLPLNGLAFADTWRGGYYPAMAKIKSGERDYTPLDVLHRENLENAFSAHGVDPKSISAGDVDRLNHAWEHLPGWDDSIEGLTRLKSRYVVGPLSNGNTALLVNMGKNASLPWDVVIGLDLLRTYKPNPDAYLGAARLLRLEPGEIMLAAAHNYDLKAAREAGFATGFILRATEHGPDQTTDLEAAADWDISVSSIIELAEELKV
ncbi:haloacid dehalogenase type II [Paenarthrobacter sp. NyZ202]|uniref:haloacid dehalogenase type II n=1 Tax=Paenarthrobacter sp. NyZ202 TaxID=3402689 RepID=UPI003CEB16E9